LENIWLVSTKIVNLQSGGEKMLYHQCLKTMKAKLKFDLNDFDDRMAHMRCVKATDMASILFEMTTNARKRITMGYDGTDEYYRGVDAVFEKLRELMEEHNIDIDELIR